MPSNLIQAIKKRNVKKVKEILDVKWDHVKRRRLDEAKEDGKGPFRHAMRICLSACCDRSLTSQKREKTFQILDEVVQNGLDAGYIPRVMRGVKKKKKNKGTYISKKHKRKPSKAAEILGDAVNQLNPRSKDCLRMFNIFIDKDVKFTRHSAYHVVLRLAKRNNVKVLKALLNTPGALVVDDVLQAEFRHDIISPLGKQNRIEFARVLLKDAAPFVRASLIKSCVTKYHTSMEFIELLLQYRVTDATCWSKNSYIREDIPQLFKWIVQHSDLRILRLLIEHGLPATPHSALYDCAFLRDGVGTSMPVIEVLIEHASQDSVLFNNRSFIEWVNDPFLLSRPNVRPDIVQLLREMPSDKIYSWVNTIHPTHISRNEECSLCYDTYNTGERIVELPCGHVFHLECMLPVAEYSRQDNCPYCRQRYI